jgi:hypothetical protein
MSSRLALGTHVTFTHRAAVARRIYLAGKPSGWKLTEPRDSFTSNRGDVLTVMTLVTPVTFVDAEELPVRPDGTRTGHRSYPVTEERWEKRNKAIFQWPEEGSGVIVGLRRKQFGISHGSGRGSGLFGDDFDPGYFENFGQVSLYVVKGDLTGPEVYVPEHAIHPVRHG